jgi:hypothetical protein
MNASVRRIFLPGLLIAGMFAALSVRPATAATPYELRDPSDQEIGCLWQCACPVLFRTPLKGGFALTPAPADPIYAVYVVSGVNWVVKTSDGETHTATGSGLYRLTLPTQSSQQQQLELDLSLDGSAPLHFDSGLVPVSAPWPAIDVDIARNHLCYDTLFAVRASPAPAGVTPHPVTKLAAPRPSPFRDRVTLGFTLEAPANVELSIHDLAGRRIRTLVTGARMGAGPHEILWDGYTDDGRRVPAGVLFVRFMAGGRTDRRLLVRVE